MPPTMNKQQTLTQVLKVLDKHYSPPEPDSKPVLEQLLYAVLREGATRDQADTAYKTLQEKFFDWNEIRVSTPQEIADALDGLPGATEKSQRVIAILQQVFETAFSYKLDDIDKKGLKNAAKQLGRFAEAGDFAVAWVVQRSLGGHALPLDAPTLRVLRRLGVVDGDEANLESLRSTLEHYIPKSRGALFSDVISLVAKDFCWAEDPHCSACPLLKECPTGQERKNTSAETKPTRLKPR
jgi:endonuclease III